MTLDTEGLFVGVRIWTALTNRDAVVDFEVRFGVGFIAVIACEVISS